MSVTRSAHDDSTLGFRSAPHQALGERPVPRHLRLRAKEVPGAGLHDNDRHQRSLRLGLRNRPSYVASEGTYDGGHLCHRPLYRGLGDHAASSHGLDDPPLTFWLYERQVYATEGHELSAGDVRALMNVAANKRRLQLEKAHALQAMTERLYERTRRERIPQQVKVAVWQRDGGRCVECGEQRNLEFDHVIPLAMGGSNTERNLQLLCETCNRTKGATLG